MTAATGSVGSWSGWRPYGTRWPVAALGATSIDYREGGETMPCQCHCGGTATRRTESPTTGVGLSSAPHSAPREASRSDSITSKLLESLATRYDHF